MDYQGHFVTKCALSLAPLVFVRPGELRHAEWNEFNLATAEWRIPAEKMKMRVTAYCSAINTSNRNSARTQSINW